MTDGDAPIPRREFLALSLLLATGVRTNTSSDNEDMKVLAEPLEKLGARIDAERARGQKT
jgi:hypothetical protein